MTESDRTRQSSLGVLGVGLGLFTIVGAALALAFMRAPIERLDPEELLVERFARVGELPFGLVPVGAERDSQRRVVLRLEGDRADEAPAPEIAGGESGDPAGEPGGESSADSGSMGRIDWDALPIAADDLAPQRGALVWYPRDRAEDVLRDLFTALRFESGERGRMGGGGGHGGGRGGKKKPEAPDPKLQDAGTIEWAGYSAPYVRLREFELDEGRPSFHESVRVNLTVGPWCCVLFLRWPDGELGSRSRTLEVLAALEPASNAPVTSDAPAD